jgi:uncharacterized membrane protein YfcA
MQNLPLWLNLLASFIVLVGATVHGAVGLGIGLLSAPILLLINPLFVPGPLLICALILTVMMTWREKQAVDLHGLGWGFVGRVLGTLAAVLILSFIPRKFISVLAASFVLAAVGLSLLKIRVRLSIFSLITAGTASGVMSTLASVGGPPFALLYQYEDSARLRATMSGFFILGTVFSIISLVLVGDLSLSQVNMSLALIPGVILGFFLSSYAIKVLNVQNTRVAVLVISALSSLAVIGRMFING